MKKILFIVNQGLISSNSNGGSSVYYSHLEILYIAGYQIELLAIQWQNNDVFNKNDYEEIKPFVKEIKTYKIESLTPKKNFNRFYNAVFKPEVFEYYFLNNKNISFLQNYIYDNKIDLVWSEWRWAGIWAGYSNLNIPVIYSHHDWEFKLAKLRKKRTLLQKFHTFQKKRVEFKLIRRVQGSVTGSNTEAKEIKNISKKEALYIPTTYKVVNSKLQPNILPNVIHLGGMETTANRLGLERFLDVCWQNIKEDHPKVRMLIIGSLKKASNSLLKKLKDPNISCLGFVKDLTNVLHPKDIHIIPWEYNTGTRTRLPLVLNYQQVLVATKASVRCYPEITNDNSVLCDDLSQMTTEIINLYSDKERLHLLSSKGKEEFLNTFVSNNQVGKIKNFINNLK